jgi:hypothetical protein
MSEQANITYYNAAGPGHAAQQCNLAAGGDLGLRGQWTNHPLHTSMAESLW